MTQWPYPASMFSYIDPMLANDMIPVLKLNSVPSLTPPSPSAGSPPWSPSRLTWPDLLGRTIYSLHVCPVSQASSISQTGNHCGFCMINPLLCHLYFILCSKSYLIVFYTNLIMPSHYSSPVLKMHMHTHTLTQAQAHWHMHTHSQRHTSSKPWTQSAEAAHEPPHIITGSSFCFPPSVPLCFLLLLAPTSAN